MISKKSIDDVLDAANVEDIVGETVELKRRGSNLIGLCPFHGEKTPSFIVSPSKNIYKCFGCGKGGRSIDFLMDFQKMSFVEAIRYLAEKYNIELEETILTDDQKILIDERESFYLINEFAAKFYHNFATNTDYGKSVSMGYFLSRGLTKEMIEQFQLGFTPNEGDGLVKAATNAGFKLEKLQEIGLANKFGKDFFSNRIMFPIKNLRGRVAGFAGRIIEKNLKAPKYINSIESLIYNKRDILYGAFDSKQSIRQNDMCILVEGYTDVIGLHQFGISNVVATSGTSLTDEQINVIKRLTNNLLFLFDGDKAGINAALRGVEKVVTKDMNVRVAILPENEDPDSFIRKVESEEFNKFTSENSEDFIIFKAKFLISDSPDDPIHKAKNLHDLVDLIAQLPDPLKRSVYASEIAKLFETNVDVVLQEINKSFKRDLSKKGGESQRNIQSNFEFKVLKPQESESSQVSNLDLVQEKDIVRLLMSYGDQIVDEEKQTRLAELVIHTIDDVIDYFEDELVKSVIGECVDLINQNQFPSPNHWLNHENPKFKDLYIEFTASPYYYSPMWEERWQIYLYSQPMPDENFKMDAMQSILRFKLKKVNKIILENQEKIKTLPRDENYEDDILSLLEVDLILKRTRNEIAKKLNTVVL